MTEIKQIIQYIPIEKLHTNPDNPRLVKDDQFKILCESVKKNADYFETRPILCNKDMMIFAGNTRYLAAKEIGLKEVPSERALKKSSLNGDIVVDAFGGSFSTLIACEQAGRSARIIELDPKYIQVGLNRWARFTGKDPVREDGKLWSEINK